MPPTTTTPLPSEDVQNPPLMKRHTNGEEQSGSAEERAEETGSSPEEEGNSNDQTPESSTPGGTKMTMEERKAKLQELRKRLAASSKANRASLIEETAKAKITAREAARLERQRKLAETLRLKADAEERGEDMERAKNWEWTVEENDEWEKKLARKARRADFEFHDDAHAARRRYKKDLDHIKPDLVAYKQQKEQAMGQSSGTLVQFDPTSGFQLVQASTSQQLASENLYRDANTLIYGDNKPSEDAVDRVVAKINKDIDKKAKFSRKRPNEDEGDITYINEHNRVFNKKARIHLIPNPSMVLIDIISPDCPILRQVHRRDSCKLRAWYRTIEFGLFYLTCFRVCIISLYTGT
ncbi:hypothetical protein AX16_003817 [Volvariella volvacea WC 439]|nr:hypothetical protein AX16_003817 [Volvariella volvacea WC 439]